MSDILGDGPTRHVMDIDPGSIGDLKRHKAVLAMQATVLRHAEDPGADQANERLLAFAGEAGMAPTLTYEDLIFSNPLDSEAGGYVMLRGAEAAAENLFYKVHRKMEDHLDNTVEALLAADRYSRFRLGALGYIKMINRDTITSQLPNVASESELTAIDALKAALHGFTAFHRRTIAIDDFNRRLKPLFIGLNNNPGPSGMFTATVPIIDLLVDNGANLDDDERTRMRADIARGLYPSHQTVQLETLLNRGHVVEISDVARGSLLRLLNGFRKSHKKTVTDYIPGALEGEADGSGRPGEKIEPYLDKKLRTDLIGKTI